MIEQARAWPEMRTPQEIQRRMTYSGASDGGNAAPIRTRGHGIRQAIAFGALPGFCTMTNKERSAIPWQPSKGN